MAVVVMPPKTSDESHQPGSKILDAFEISRCPDDEGANWEIHDSTALLSHFGEEDDTTNFAYVIIAFAFALLFLYYNAVDRTKVGITLKAHGDGVFFYGFDVSRGRDGLGTRNALT